MRVLVHQFVNHHPRSSALNTTAVGQKFLVPHKSSAPVLLNKSWTAANVAAYKAGLESTGLLVSYAIATLSAASAGASARLVGRSLDDGSFVTYVIWVCGPNLSAADASAFGKYMWVSRRSSTAVDFIEESNSGMPAKESLYTILADTTRSDYSLVAGFQTF